MGKIDLSELKKQAKENPGDADLLHTYGVALVQAHGAIDEGLVQLRAALKIRPDSAEIANDVGLALVAAGKVSGCSFRSLFVVSDLYSFDYKSAVMFMFICLCLCLCLCFFFFEKSTTI